MRRMRTPSCQTRTGRTNGRRRTRIRRRFAITLSVIVLSFVLIFSVCLANLNEDLGSQSSKNSGTEVCADKPAQGQDDDDSSGHCSSNQKEEQETNIQDDPNEQESTSLLNQIASEKLNEQATNYILSLLEHHIPTTAASLNDRRDQLPLVVTLTIIVCIIVLRVVFVGVLLGILVGMVSAGPIVFASRYFCADQVSAKNECGDLASDDEGSDEAMDKIDTIPRTSSDKSISFAPGTKETDGDTIKRPRRRKTNQNARKEGKKKKTGRIAPIGIDGGSGSGNAAAISRKEKRKMKKT